MEKSSHLVVSAYVTSKQIRYVVGDVSTHWSSRSKDRPKVHVITAPDITNFNDRLLYGLSLAMKQAVPLLGNTPDNTVLLEVQSSIVFGWLNSFEVPAERRPWFDTFFDSWNKVPAKFQMMWTNSPVAKKKLPVMDLDEDTTSILDALGFDE